MQCCVPAENPTALCCQRLTLFAGSYTPSAGLFKFRTFFDRVLGRCSGGGNQANALRFLLSDDPRNCLALCFVKSTVNTHMDSLHTDDYSHWICAFEMLAFIVHAGKQKPTRIVESKHDIDSCFIACIRST